MKKRTWWWIVVDKTCFVAVSPAFNARGLAVEWMYDEHLPPDLFQPIMVVAK